MTTATGKSLEEKIEFLRGSIDRALRAGENQERFDLNPLLGDVRQAIMSVHGKSISFRIAKSMIRASQKRLGIPTSWDEEWNRSTAPRGLGRKKIEAKIGRLLNGIYRESNAGRVKAEREMRQLRKEIADLREKLNRIVATASPAKGG